MGVAEDEMRGEVLDADSLLQIIQESGSGCNNDRLKRQLLKEAQSQLGMRDEEIKQLIDRIEGLSKYLESHGGDDSLIDFAVDESDWSDVEKVRGYVREMWNDEMGGK